MKAIETVNDEGRYTKNIPIFEGTHVFKADEIIIKNLKEQKNLLGWWQFVHSYPHSWRSKAPLKFIELHHNGLYNGKSQIEKKNN